MTLFLNPMIDRIRTACLTVPRRKDWLWAGGLLLLYALIYLPIGFHLGFLQVSPQSGWQTIIGVTAQAFLMPGLLEELGFRVLPIPHPKETVAASVRWFWVVLSWLLFLVYHLNPFAPLFFSEPAFLIGAGLLGGVCTISYLQSGSLWTPVAIHWLSVVTWLLFLGGLEKFQ
ncbi:CPBP family intramembrane metalloprotease [Kovacikia minuta CCNUW1]|uniref:CPBP family glutamic-type intramembrane protease n=1 Tax=Kovacikia minuta TaxID=2931930 RepID=UPI001CCE26CA|nr:CPBP family glutamic-type intramembrane protease [Kovacikia minuta]UBF25483.1 CPBP family intramembrane metalloprotease [Kovacikia minuta CCNUW1]